MMNWLKRLRRDDRGAAVVELAIVSPMIALLTVGIVDMSNGFSRKLKIEQAAQRSIEKIMNTSASDTIEKTLAAEAAAQANVSVENVSVDYRLECDGVVTDAAECPEDQDTSQWISVSVTDKYEPMFTRHFGGINGDGTYHLSATAGVRIQ
ncbi:MAG: TadE/TadG family type IV pilus assembly protein [Sphingomicrobium sp.]